MKSPSNQTLFRTAPCRALRHDTPPSRPPPRRRTRCGRCVDSGPRCRGSANTPCLGSHGFLTKKSRKIDVTFYGFSGLVFFGEIYRYRQEVFFLTRKIYSKGCLQTFVKCWEWSWSKWGGHGHGDSTFQGDFDRRIGDFFGRDPQRC